MSTNFPLLLHVFGAMTLVGAVGTAAGTFLLAWRRDAAAYTRFGFRTLLFAALPAYILMRIGAEWLYVRTGLDDAPEDPGWIGVGYITADAGAILLLVSLIVTGIGTRRLRTSGAEVSALTRTGAVLGLILVAAWLVAVWAMTVKPD